MGSDSTRSHGEQPTNIRTLDYTADEHGRMPQEYYDSIKAKFADERDVRLGYRPPGTDIYTSDLTGELGHYATDPHVTEVEAREPLDDTVEVLFIGGGFSALLTSARLREKGVESIRIVERGGDVGGTWYWNRYPGVACDVVSYDYLPLLDETGYVPSRHYAGGEEIWQYCRSIADRYDLYDLAVFQTTVTSTVWDEATEMWHIGTDRGDTMKAKFVICANGTLSKPRLAKIDGIERFEGHSFHTSRWDYAYTGADLENLADKRGGHHRHWRQQLCRPCPEPRQGHGQGAVRLPAHPVVDRCARRLGHRPRVGRPLSSRVGRPSRRARAIAGPSAHRGADWPKRAADAVARKRSAARRTPTSTR